MFTSHSLLSRKGPLGVIWVAAYFHKKLKKAQVTETDISSSVDWILQDEFNVVTYRVLAYLLLGVVRVYSKKVEYLYDDCNEVLLKINEFVVTKRDDACMETLRAPYFSITLPDRFELDTFDLDVHEDISGANVMPNEEITLKDGAWKGDGIAQYFLDEYHCEEFATHASSSPSHCTPAEDVLPSNFMDMDVDIRISHNLSNLEASMEGLQGNRFSQVECGSLEMSCGAEEEPPDSVESFDKDHQPDREQIKVPEVIQLECEKRQLIEDCSVSNLDTSMEELQKNRFSQEEVAIFYEAGKEHPDLVRASGGEQMKFLEMTSSEIVKSQVIAEEHPVSITLHVTTQSKFPDAPGASTPEIMAIPTPATKERARISRKRKCLYDNVLVLPNKVLKQSIDDSTDLVCIGRKAPYTALAAWKACKISSLSQGFLEPLIPCSSAELRSLFSGPAIERLLFSEKDPEIPESVGGVEIPEKLDVLESSTIDRALEQPAFAPETPVPRSTSMRSFGSLGDSKSDIARPASSFLSVEKEPSQCEDQELDLNLLNEEINLCEEEDQELHGWSGRTRVAARYLHRIFQNQKKRREEEVVKLLCVLEGRTKKESARLFYEMLVLRTKGYVDVKQDNAYDNILVQKLPKWEQIFGAGDGL